MQLYWGQRANSERLGRICVTRDAVQIEPSQQDLEAHLAEGSASPAPWSSYPVTISTNPPARVKSRVVDHDPNSLVPTHNCNLP